MERLLQGAEFARFRRFEVKPLTKEQQRSMVSLHFEQQAERNKPLADLVGQFEKQMERNKSLAGLTDNPLLLSLILSAWKSMSDADSVSTVEIYEIALNGILERLQSTKKLQNAGRNSSSDTISAGMYRTLFRQMAFAAHTSTAPMRDFHDDNVVRPAISAMDGGSFTLPQWRALVDTTLKKGHMTTHTRVNRV